MNFPNGRVLLIGRLDGTRGPLGVAKALHTRLAKMHDCQTDEAFTFADVLRRIVKIPFAYKGYSICVHQNGFRIPLILCLLSKIDHCNTYYLVVHGIAAEERKYRPVLNRDLRIESKLIKEFPNLICVSEFERHRLFHLYGEREGVCVIHNGVDALEGLIIERNILDDSALLNPIFITTGGFEQRKAVDLALSMLTQLTKLGYKPKLVVCGRDSVETGSNRALCEDIARDGGIDLVYEGEINDKKRLWLLYSQAHFYIGLSRFDTFNVSVLEGAAAGCVPIVSTTCGVAELFDEASAFLVDVDDCDAVRGLTDNIAATLNDGSEYSKLSVAAREVARISTWDRAARQYWRILSHE